ncbi:haloalkane dehalogenase [Litorivivens sp.]|uniref:haloalkane dehalogenase n=1 Tax=Litorivivens sp. TaxID=2020868 RepID=UPI0035614581
MMKVLRTPDSRFQDLPGYDFEPHYLNINDDDGTELRVHYIDEGPRDAEPILLMHGNPTWVYLYRKMIPGLLETGRRVLAVDLVGLGRSDKPAKRRYYTQARHIDWMSKWLTAMDLQHITLFCQDWGGTIGLHLVAKHPERFDRVVASNTGLGDGQTVPRALRIWQWGMKLLPIFPLRYAIRSVIQTASFSEAELEAYVAPFPSRKYQTAILAFPQLLPTHPNMPGVADNLLAWEKLSQLRKPFLTLFGTRDPMTRGSDEYLQQVIPGAAGQAHQRISGAGHFTQEDKPEELVHAITNFLNTSEDG